MTPLRAAGCTEAAILEHTRSALTRKPIQSDFEGRLLHRVGELTVVGIVGPIHALLLQHFGDRGD